MLFWDQRFCQGADNHPCAPHPPFVGAFLQAKLVQSVSPQGGTQAPFARAVPLTVKGCAAQRG
jgi:hypothetical protein